MFLVTYYLHICFASHKHGYRLIMESFTPSYSWVCQLYSSDCHMPLIALTQCKNEELSLRLHQVAIIHPRAYKKGATTNIERKLNSFLYVFILFFMFYSTFENRNAGKAELRIKTKYKLYYSKLVNIRT